MTYVSAQLPELSAAATDLTGVGSAIDEAIAAAAGPTTSVATAAADEVSAAIAQMFGAYGAEWQAISAQLAAYHICSPMSARRPSLMPCRRDPTGNPRLHR
jgi:hypothetical protein